jgi:hypothetical protein
MENCGVLDPNDDLHLFCLHYVYVPRINKHLDRWKEGYIHHKIRTAGNKTPMQLYILGLLRQRNSNNLAVQQAYEPLSEVSHSSKVILHFLLKML